MGDSSNILDKHGVDVDGKEIPQFASEVNKQLDAEVKRKETELEAVEEKLEADGERVKVLTDHLVNVQQELVHTQQLVDAKKSELETEEHLKALTNRQLGRLKSEILNLQKVMDDTQDRVNALSNELMKGNERLDQFKLEMNWNQEKLEQWAIAARQKEEDELTIEKYKRADDAKVRELTLATEKLTVENSEKRKELADQVTETQAKQIEMDKTAELFRELHEERRKLVAQWEDSVNSMKTRDDLIEKLSNDYESNGGRLREKQRKMKERQKFQDEAENENKSLENTIAVTDRQLVRVRLDHHGVKNELGNFKDEVEVIKNQLSACETERTNTRNQMNIMNKSLEDRNGRHAKMNAALNKQSKALDDHQQKSKDKDQMSADAEAARIEMLGQLKLVEKELKAAKENLYKESQELYRLRADEATTLGEISGAQSAIKNLQFQISKLDTERQRQQELLYAVDFQSQLMQRKVARVSGERTVEEKEEFQKRMDQLNRQMEEQKSLHKILSAQVKRQDADLKAAKRVLSSITKETDGTKVMMEELELQNTITNKTVSATVKDKEDYLMQHDVLRLEVKRLRQQLNTKSENLYSLENRKQQLKISMEEREKEIEVHQDVKRAQLRSAEEERHKSAIELAERKQKIYNLKMKYENVVNKVKKEDGDEGHSQAYYVLKAAQAKEELQRRGDELDDKIRRAEREIKALENTLGHLLARNTKYKENFQNANSQNQTEMEEKQMLEEQSQAANEVLFRRKRELQRLEREEAEDARRYEELHGALDKLESQVREQTGARDVLSQDIESQVPKLDRARRTLEEWRQKAATAGHDLGPDAPATLDVEARALRDQNQSVLFALSNALQDHPDDVLPLFERLCREQGVARPSRPPSVASSRPGSASSSARRTPA